MKTGIPRNKNNLAAYQRALHRLNPELLRERDRLRKQKVMEFVNSFKKECVLCGFGDKRALDFHHKDPKEREFKISDRAKAGARLSVLEKEIKKCVVLCANCHRILHAPVAEGKDLEPIGRGPMLSE